MTFYALFADDVRILLSPKDLDDLFYGITTAAMGVFLIEVVLESLGTQNYLLGFYFWLDLIASVSMITDIGWIWHRIIGIENV